MDITQESFEALLKWLDPDRDIAGQKYETIRQGLIRIFASKGINHPEKWADETINRVAQKIPRDPTDEPMRYFMGFVRNIIHEANREKEIPTDEFPDLASEIIEPDDRYECLVQCLKFFKERERDLILDYYVYSGHDKVETHKEMAEELGISQGALRNRAFQLRAKLEKAVLKCVSSRKENKKDLKNHNQ